MVVDSTLYPSVPQYEGMPTEGMYKKRTDAVSLLQDEVLRGGMPETVEFERYFSIFRSSRPYEDGLSKLMDRIVHLQGLENSQTHMWASYCVRRR